MTTNNGLLLLDKPSGCTSHDVVARVRKSLGERRVGHAGTLDPMATGLLVLAVGPSTRLLRFAQDEHKHYEGTVVFGVATDSLDADGVVTERRATPVLEADAVRAACADMLGTQRQTPPMVSAIKVDGQRLHELARRGLEVERDARSITVTTFALTPTDVTGEWRFDVVCSVGTYVRVLLSDLAQRLGTIGHLNALRRLASGDHLVDEALTLEEFERRAEVGEVVLAPPVDFVHALEHVTVSADTAARLRQGQRVALDAAGEHVAALDEAGSLVAVLHRRGETFQPDVVLPAPEIIRHG